MEARSFKIENYITVPGFAIVELGLSGNELLCYSLIYGFTQDKETEFRGSLNYVSSALNVTKQNAKKIIDRLIDRGLIEKREMFFSGVKFCHYIANRHGVAEIATGCPKKEHGVTETATGGGIDSAPNNTNNDKTKDIYNNIPADGGLFEDQADFKPVVVTAPRGTSEQAACLFANSRFADYELFKAQFTSNEYQGVDIAYYYGAVSDWSASNGKKRKDWIATTRNFIRNDMENKKVHMLQNGLSPDEIDYLKEMADLDNPPVWEN